MRTILVNIGGYADGTGVISYLRQRKDIRLCAVTCTDEEEQYRRLVKVCGEVPVYTGTSKALLEAGNNENSVPTLGERAWDKISENVEKEDELEILNFGSLTNLALAFVRYPNVMSRAAGIMVIGGSAESGDVTPFAERGIYADPLAAKIVFGHTPPVTMAGLDVMKAWKRRSLQEREALMAAAVLSAEHYQAVHCFVGIETKSEKTRGMTVCDLYHRMNYEANAFVVTEIDRKKTEAELAAGEKHAKKKIPVIIDTDPGHDDAFAIMMALASDRIELKGLTTVAGNSLIENTTRNALRILERVGRTDVPVAQGIGRPMCHELQYEVAKQYHGESGLDGPVFPEVTTPLCELDAVSFIARTVRESEEPVTLVPIGPLTNIAAFLLSYPELAGNIRQICMMGGLSYPNPNSATIVSEYNVFQDIEAARIVFQSGIPIVMHTINSTGQGKVGNPQIDQMAELGNAGRFAAELMDFYRRVFRRNHLEYYNICDSHAIAYLIDSSIYLSRTVDVELDLDGEYTYGMTVCDLREGSIGDGMFTVVEDCDLQRYFDLMFDCLRKLG